VSSPPVLVVSDTHLGPGTPAALGRDLAALVVRHPGHEVLLAGDVFDLSFARSGADSGELLSALLERSPEVVSALHAHAARGDRITIIPGNHDDALGAADVATRLGARLELSGAAPLDIHRWFVRRGPVHIEHGHVYDPDNAPLHPLVECDDTTEPLGVALTRRFVAARGALVYSHAQESTPVAALAHAFHVYGRRAPVMIAQYFHTAFQLCVEAGPRRRAHSGQHRELGERRLMEFARLAGVSDDEVRAMLHSAPAPRHASRREVFLRLYFDRVLATLLLGASVASLPARPWASLTALASLAYLAGSVARGKNRYAGMPQDALADAADRIRELSGAELVVFGHTHVEQDSAGYVNTGSFAFPKHPGRPYVTLDRDGRVERRRLDASS
jgi:UDP-2,3-diacylglucosamine pyrophosphatase LpxH